MFALLKARDNFDGTHAACADLDLAAFGHAVVIDDIGNPARAAIQASCLVPFP